MADLIEIHTAAVEREMELQEVILRAIDGRVRWLPRRRDPGDFGRLGAFIGLIPQINPKRAQSVHHVFSTSQSG